MKGKNDTKLYWDKINNKHWTAYYIAISKWVCRIAGCKGRRGGKQTVNERLLGEDTLHQLI